MFGLGSFWLDAKYLQQKLRRFAVEMLICAKQTFLFPVAGLRAMSKRKKNADYEISVLHTLLTLRETVEISDWKSSLNYRWDTSLSPPSVVSAEGLQVKVPNTYQEPFFQWAPWSSFQLLLYNIWHLCCHSCWKSKCKSSLAMDNSHETDTTKIIGFFYKCDTETVMKALSKGGWDDAFMAQDFNRYPEFT